MTDNNSNQLSLQELRQRKHDLEWQRNKWTGIMVAIIMVPLALEHILEHFLAEDTVTRIIGITYIFLIPFLGYLAVKFTKWTWGINDAEREIKKAEKQQAETPEKKEPTSGFSSRPNHTWSEKVARALGAITLSFIFLILAISLLGSFDLIHYDFPQWLKVNYSLIVFGSLWIGQCMLRYRSDLSLVSRISIWSAVTLLLASLPLLYMEYKIGIWLLLITFIIGVINIFRIEKEIFFLKQDDMDS